MPISNIQLTHFEKIANDENKNSNAAVVIESKTVGGHTLKVIDNQQAEIATITRGNHSAAVASFVNALGHNASHFNDEDRALAAEHGLLVGDIRQVFKSIRDNPQPAAE